MSKGRVYLKLDHEQIWATGGLMNRVAFKIELFIMIIIKTCPSIPLSSEIKLSHPVGGMPTVPLTPGPGWCRARCPREVFGKKPSTEELVI